MVTKWLDAIENNTVKQLLLPIKPTAKLWNWLYNYSLAYFYFQKFHYLFLEDDTIIKGYYKERVEITKWLNSQKPKEINGALENIGTTPLREGCKLSDLMARPQINFQNLSNIVPALKEALDSPQNRKEEIAEATEIKMKYKGYIERERMVADKMHRLEDIKIKDRFNFSEMQQLSTEARQKLEKINPETLAQASRISGVSPSDINVMLVLLGR